MQEPPRAAAGLFLAVLAGVAVLLLIQLDSQTKWIDGLRLAAQPRLLPLVALMGVALFALGAALLARHGLSRPHGLGAEMIAWARPGEYVLYYMAYVKLVPVIGYGFATAAFCPLLAWRVGCTRTQCAIAAVFGVAVVLIFKAGLSVKIPGASWYEALPGAWRNFLILNF